MREELICTVCPLGCRLRVEYEGRVIASVQGNRCHRGVPYAEKEVLDPERVVTTTVAVSGGIIPLAPVKTSAGVPRDRVSVVMREAYGLVLKAPLRLGQVAVKNIGRTGTDLVVTRTVPQKKPAG